MAGLLPGLGYLRGRVFGWFLRRDADLAGVVAVQAPIAGVHLASDIGELLEQVVDAVSLQGGLVVLAAGPERGVQKGPPAVVADLGELDGVHLLLAGDERPPPGAARRGAADLDLAAVEPQRDPAGGGVGEHVGERAEPPALGGGVSPAGQQRPDLPHGAGHRAAVHAVHLRQRGVRDLQPQHRQRDQHPVGEDQLVAPAGAVGAAPVSAPPPAKVRLPARHPRAGQLGHYLAQVMTGDTDEGRMAQGRTSP